MRAATALVTCIVFVCLSSQWVTANDGSAQPGVTPGTPQTNTPVPAPPTDEPRPRRSIGHHLLMYIPNRIFDVLDIVRAKAGFGPGFSVGVRLTDYMDFWVGAETVTWVGLPGPRRTPRVPLPVGMDTRVGAEIASAEAVDSPTEGTLVYAPDEIGVQVHPILVSAEVGVSVQEALDAVFGFLFIDIVGDDL